MFKKSCLFFLFVIGVVKAQSVDPLRAKDVKAQQKWVDSIMSSMSIDQKIGQLFMVAAYSNKDDAHSEKIIKMIEKYHVGNLIFMKGEPHKQIKLNNLFQSKAKLPLMIGFDGEWGLDMRLKNTYRFPWNMTLGAVRNNELIQDLGKRIGAHCKRVGIHVNFAPVVDINTNPRNPIIGNRSFGERKENVAEKAIAFTKGMQKVGVLANAKHFPGHGDTSQDSHKTLPSILFTEKRIDSVELYPYRRLFDVGLASVMVAHLNIPSLEIHRGLPSSLSKNIVTNILKNKLGFLGLIFTDGLNMRGASNFSSSAEVNLAAFLAGNDILLIPEDIPNTVRLFKKSLLNHRLSIQRLNHSVRKILRAKYLVGLHNYKPIVTDNLEADLKTVKDELLHRKLVEKSLTLVKNDQNLLPLKKLEDKKIAYVKFGDAPNEDFVNMLKKYTKVDVVYSRKLIWLKGALRKYNTVIVGFHKSNLNPWKSYEFSAKEVAWLEELAKDKRIILDVFASPYALLQLRSVKNITAILVSYQNSKLSQELSAQAIFGAIPINGKLPVSIRKTFPVGTGISVKPLNRLGYSIAEDVGISSDSLNRIDLYADFILKTKMAPGMQILVARQGKVVYNKSFGYHTDKKQQQVKNSDVYDLASLTKILSTLPLLMKSHEKGMFTLNTSLGELLPYLKGANKDTVTVKEVLSHYGRLASWIPFYKRTQSDKGENLKKYYNSTQTKKFTIQVAEKLFLDGSWKDSIQEIITNVSQKPRLRYKYSDIGYYFFKDFLEKKYRKSLNNLVEDEFYKSLGLNRTAYLPLRYFSKEEIIPTEKDKYFRKQLLHGYVHDQGAAMLGGVGGHAGLFANANDVAKFMQMYLQEGSYGGKTYLNKQTVNTFNKRYYAEAKNRRGLGFDKPQINPKEKSTCACVSQHSFGHSGYTGTYAWADPETEIIYVFLSNRVYPTAKNRGMVKTNIRTKIQRLIQNSIIF